MNSLEKLENDIMKIATRIGSKLLSRYLATYRMKSSDVIVLLRSGSFDINLSDIEGTYKINKAWLEGDHHKISSVLFFIVPFGKEPSAGPRNILGLAKYFLSKGVELYFAIISNDYNSLKVVEDTLKFHGIDAKSFIVLKPEHVDSLPHSTISIATFWTTAYPLLRFHNTDAKVYLIQDEETAFYPAGISQYFAEYTYHFGFIGITNAHEIKEWYEGNYHMPCFYFPPFIIRSNKRRDPNASSMRRIFTYLRYGAPRNAPELLYMVLEEIKRKYDVEITIVGDKLPKKEFKSLGWVGADKLRELYENSDACLYFMFSRHPGVIPLECMDAGAVVITNRKHIKHSYLVHEYNALVVEPTLNSVIKAFDKVFRDVSLQKQLIRNGYKTVDEIFKDHNEKLEKFFKELSREII
jgi:hypothetical protein